jgi:hypothetical protein
MEWFMRKFASLLLTRLFSHSNTNNVPTKYLQVKIRHDPTDLESDVSLKLRVANGTHTAVAHAMALLSMVNTEALCRHPITSDVILSYLDSLYRAQILPGALYDGISASETDATWIDGENGCSIHISGSPLFSLLRMAPLSAASISAPRLEVWSPQVFTAPQKETIH